jgi:similar to stage IV sporulation protein
LSVLLLLAMARSVIWNIEIDGNDRLSRAHILSLLAENGVEVGSPLRALQIDRVEGNLLLAEKDISWVALYAVGTTLHVQVRETERGAPPEQGAANLVAARDGVIERIEVYDGNLAVKVGDVVRQGELLVSGVYDAAAGGAIRTTFAEGEVFARTAREYTVEIPLLYEQKVYTGREWSEKRIKFFAKSIKVFANSGNAPTTCDIIYYNYSLNFFGGDPLPLGMSTAVYREYRIETVELSPQSAAAQAFSEIEGELARLSEGIELLEKRYSFELTDTAYVLTCRITCVENIAVTQPIKLGA